MRTEEILLEFQPEMLGCPIAPEKAHAQVASADDVTIKHWKETWLSNIKANSDNFGSFAEKSAGKFFNSANGAPAIVAGAGPSLKKNAHLLKTRPDYVKLISCLHNFHFLEDAEANVDFYVTLDAGPVTIAEVTEGGGKTEDEYWELSKNRKLIAYIGSNPELLKKWRGEVYFFNAAIPDESILRAIGQIQNFNLFIESGGSVLGTCLFFAKGILGSQTSIFVGADFCFSTEPKRRFHSWDSKYDQDIGACLSAVNIFGNRVLTWNSYYNFKLWMEVVAQRVPGIYINATEGGILGAHRDGNISFIKQMWLEDVLDMLTLSRHKQGQATNPEICDNKILI